MSSTETWIEGDEFADFRTSAALDAEDKRIAAQMQQLGPRVDVGDKEATREYLSLVDRQLALSDERSRRRRGEPSPVPSPTASVPSAPTVSNERRRAENDLSATRGQLQTLDAQCTATRTPEAAMEREIAVRQVKAAELALPYVGYTDADLTAQVEDIEASVEELRETRDAVPEGSVRRSRAERAWAEALTQKDRVTTELRARYERRAVEQVVQQQVRKRAIEGIKADRQKEVRELTKLADDQALSRSSVHG